MDVTLRIAHKGIDIGLVCTSAEKDNSPSTLLDLYCLVSKFYMRKHYTIE